MAAAPQIGACVITAPPVDVFVVEVPTAEAALLILLSAAAALLLILDISFCKLLFAAPVAVASTLLRLLIALEASLCAAENAEFARLVPVEMAPPA